MLSLSTVPYDRTPASVRNLVARKAAADTAASGMAVSVALRRTVFEAAVSEAATLGIAALD